MPRISLTALLITAICGLGLLFFTLLFLPGPRQQSPTQTADASGPKPEHDPFANPFPSTESRPASVKIQPPVTLVTLKTPATISIGGQAETIQADPIGLYPRLQVPPKATIPIHLRVNPNELVREEVLDGGKLDDKSQIRFQYSNSSGNLDFDYLIRGQPGNYRVAVYRQGLRQILNFWVGPELPQRVPVSTE